MLITNRHSTYTRKGTQLNLHAVDLVQTSNSSCAEHEKFDIFHVQMSRNKELRSLTLGSAHEKFDV